MSKSQIKRIAIQEEAVWRELLEAAEWSGESEGEYCCPVCGFLERYAVHDTECQLCVAIAKEKEALGRG